MIRLLSKAILNEIALYILWREFVYESSEMAEIRMDSVKNNATENYKNYQIYIAVKIIKKCHFYWKKIFIVENQLLLFVPSIEILSKYSCLGIIRVKL